MPKDLSAEIEFLIEGRALLQQALEYAGPGVTPKIEAALEAQAAQVVELEEEQAESAEGSEDGTRCNRNGCEGIIEVVKPENCSCHVNPPCDACVDAKAGCAVCGWEED